MNRDSIYATMFANIESCVRTISEAMMRMKCACTMCSAKRDRMYEGRERERERAEKIDCTCVPKYTRYPFVTSSCCDVIQTLGIEIFNFILDSLSLQGENAFCFMRLPVFTVQSRSRTKHEPNHIYENTIRVAFMPKCYVKVMIHSLSLPLSTTSSIAVIHTT